MADFQPVFIVVLYCKQRNNGKLVWYFGYWTCKHKETISLIIKKINNDQYFCNLKLQSFELKGTTTKMHHLIAQYKLFLNITDTFFTNMRKQHQIENPNSI